MSAPTTAGLLAAILALATATYVLRLAGPLLRARVDLSSKTRELMETTTIVLLLAVIATATFLDGDSVAGPARPAGVLVAGLLAWRRAPFVVVVMVAAAATAGLRLAGLP